MGDNHRLKRPKAEPGKRIAAHESQAIDTFNLPPKFCLRQMRNGYSLLDCQKDEKAAFADRLYELSRLTWKQINQAGRHGQGFEKIERTAILGDAVPDSISEDVHIIAFRCIGRAPMVGYRSVDGVFNVLWIDRGFTLFKH